MDVTFLNPFDAGDLRRLAVSIDDHAVTISARADRLVGAVHAARWKSPAATQFGLQAHDVAGGLRRSAQLLHTAARTLRSHAENVQAVQDVIRAAERLAEVAAEAAGDVALGAARSAGTAAHAIGRFL